jgi:hypothetical protein
MRGPTSMGPPLVVEEDMETILSGEGEIVGLVDPGKTNCLPGTIYKDVFSLDWAIVLFVNLI